MLEYRARNMKSMAEKGSRTGGQEIGMVALFDLQLVFVIHCGCIMIYDSEPKMDSANSRNNR